MPRKLISVSVLLTVMVLLATLIPSCRREEPESTPPPPTSETGQNFLIEVVKPDDAWAPVSVNVTCKIEGITMADEVEFGTVGISFPDLSDARSISFRSSTLDSYSIYAPGEKVYTKYGYGSEVTVQYPILEGYQAIWGRNVKENITFQVRPEHAGTFTFYVKAYGSVFKEGKLLTAHEPLGGTKDQQEEYVQVHSFQVAAPD